MLHLIIFTPLIAALLIMIGAARAENCPARIHPYACPWRSGRFFCSTNRVATLYVRQLVGILPEWHSGVQSGLDGLSLIMVLLAAIVTVAPFGSP